MATRIISWNLNGLRAAAKKGFLDWFDQTRPDILCIQESRVLPDEIDVKTILPKGYCAHWMPAKKKGYSGVATFSRSEPLSVSNMGHPEFDDEGRVQILEYKAYTIINAYFPNSQPERKRIEYKIRFCDTLWRICNKLVRSGKNVVLCGDYNIAHTEIDLARPKQNEESPGYLPEEREAMTKFLKAGYVDTFRHFVKDPGH